MRKRDATRSSSEEQWIDQIARLVGNDLPGEIGIGDDAAVIEIPNSRFLFSSDLLAEGVHFDRSFCDDFDIGWKAMAVNVSDIAAMGGRPWRCVVSLAGVARVDLERLYAGLLAVSGQFGGQIVGGDCSDGSSFIISIAVIGVMDEGDPVLRSGAGPGDGVYVSGPLGASAAGLRQLQRDPGASGPLVDAHRRPVPRLDAGRCAAHGGVSAMMDLSDGLGIDLHRLAGASTVGVALDDVPVARGATVDDALGGGEDYELLFTAPDERSLCAAFEEMSVAQPRRIGTVVPPEAGITFRGTALPALGFRHGIGPHDAR